VGSHGGIGVPCFFRGEYSDLRLKPSGVVRFPRVRERYWSECEDQLFTCYSVGFCCVTVYLIVATQPDYRARISPVQMDRNDCGWGGYRIAHPASISFAISISISTLPRKDPVYR
jgi:hypothetical protein